MPPRLLRAAPVSLRHRATESVTWCRRLRGATRTQAWSSPIAPLRLVALLPLAMGLIATLGIMTIFGCSLNPANMIA
ncbi:MAG: hypothetical protein ABL966_06925, partial [Acidimicrobiales bacterium]